MDREKRADKELFRVLEIFVEHVGHVLRKQTARPKYSQRHRMLAA